MRTLIVGLAAALSALVLGGAAIAGQGGFNLASDDSDDVAEALATEETTEDTEDGDLEEATEDTEVDDSKDESKPEAEEADVLATETPFGEIRSAEVHAAIEAGEQPEPAWKNPAHPTGGPEGEQTQESTDDEGDDDGDVEESAVEAPANDTADDKRADAEHRPSKGD